MENLPQEKNTSAALDKISQNEQAKLIKAKNYRKASDSMPRKIEQVFDQPKIFELNKVIGEANVTAMVEFELINLAALMTVGGNLNIEQIRFIAASLIDEYPKESIADFKICFNRGAMGHYGEIQRMDGITINSWMKKYLEEKYKLLEDQLMKERDDQYNQSFLKNLDRDWLAEWQKAIDEVDATKSVRPMTDEEIKNEGQVKPQREVYAYNASEAEINLREAREKLWRYQEMTVRERHPDWTEEQIKARCEELKNTILENDSQPKHLTSKMEKIWHEKRKKI